MPTQQAASPLVTMFPLVLIFVVFYFMLIRPQKKQEKLRQKMIGELTKNDEIITTFGVHGTVVNIKDKTVVVRVDENVKIEIEKSAVGIVKKQQVA